MKTVLPCLLCLTLAGCATTDLVFITKTSVSIVDADGAAGEVAFGYSRVEGFSGITCSNGTVPPVVAVIAGDNDIFNAEISQVFATGRAAVRAVNTSGDKSPPTLGGADGRRAYFGTSTTLGMKVGFKNGEPASFVLGHRRREAAYIPIAKDKEKGACESGGSVPSVLATFDTNSGAAGAAASLAVKQVFATGRAADELADDFKPVIKAAVKAAEAKQDAALEMTKAAIGAERKKQAIRLGAEPK